MDDSKLISEVHRAINIGLLILNLFSVLEGAMLVVAGAAVKFTGRISFDKSHSGFNNDRMLTGNSNLRILTSNTSI